MEIRPVQTPAGWMTFAAEDGAICRLDFGRKEGSPGEDALLVEAERQLLQYFARERRSFALPLAPKGTPFQKAVWEELCRIPYGETRTYGQIAAAIGNPRACRAVGMANNRNPISILIPCHRVIGANGALVGYGGGMEIKTLLLQLEGWLR